MQTTTSQENSKNDAASTEPAKSKNDAADRRRSHGVSKVSNKAPKRRPSATEWTVRCEERRQQQLNSPVAGHSFLYIFVHFLQKDLEHYFFYLSSP